MVRRADSDKIKSSARRALNKVTAIYVSDVAAEQLERSLNGIPLFTHSDLPVSDRTPSCLFGVRRLDAALLLMTIVRDQSGVNPPRCRDQMESLEVLLEECERLHGHMCAGQLLGTRMALLGCRLIGVDDPVAPIVGS